MTGEIVKEENLSSNPCAVSHKTLMPSSPALTTQERVLVVLAALLFAHALFAWSTGFTHTISDRAGFRQTQTAIEIQRMLDGGPKLFYETPVWGPPWAFPQEFPIYQWVTAAFISLTGMPLMEAGRAVSLLFFFLTLLAAWKTLGAFDVPRTGKFAITILLLSCPIYLFWPRTCMIETCSLAFGLGYVCYATNAAKRLTWRTLIIAAALGSLAATVKITTFLPLLILVIGYLLFHAVSQRVSRKEMLLQAAFLLAVPAALGLLWAAVFSRVDYLNPLYLKAFPPDYLRVWVFGTLKDRFSSEFWGTFFHRVLPDTLGISWALILIFAACLMAVRRYAVAVFVASAMFLLPILIYPRLHQIHDYYQTENAFFLCAACGFAVCGLLLKPGLGRAAGWALLLFVVAAGVARYYRIFYPSAHTDFLRLKLVGDRVQSLTTPQQLIIVRGEDWSSEVPFYSQRRAIMDRDFSPELLHRQVAAALPAQVADVVFCDAARRELENLDVDEKLEKVSQMYGVKMSRSLDDGICFHFTNGQPGRRLQPTTKMTGSMPFLSFLDLPQNGAEVAGSFTTAGWVLSLPLTKEIDVEIDGKPVASGGTGGIRLDLMQPFPKYPGHPFNGFNIQVSSKGLSKGDHVLSLHAVLEDGSDHFLGETRIFKR